MEFYDHHPLPISIQENEARNVERRFRFESSWLIEESNKDMVASAWSSSTSYQKLDNIKTKVVYWNMHTLHSIQNKKRKMLERLKSIQNSFQFGKGHHV